MKNLVAVVAMAMVMMGAGSAAEAADSMKRKPAAECADENGCNNRPEAPRTRGLKQAKQKECDENGCNNRPEAPRTRGLKQAKQKECPTAYCE